MSTSQSTQCQTVDLEQSNLDSTSSRLRKALFQDLDRADYLDANDAEHLAKLKEWCRTHWTVTFRRAFLNFNVMHFHACCNSFSKRTFVKVAGHPVLQTTTLNKLPAFKTIETAEDLFRWLLQMAKNNEKYGEKTLFPTVNRRHYEWDQTEDEKTLDTEEEELLKKRCHALQTELEITKSLTKDLQADNARLLDSSKAWHAKYHELLELNSQAVDVFYTPMKRTNNSIMFLENS